MRVPDIFVANDDFYAASYSAAMAMPICPAPVNIMTFLDRRCSMGYEIS